MVLSGLLIDFMVGMGQIGFRRGIFTGRALFRPCQRRLLERVLGLIIGHHRFFTGPTS